MFVKHLLCVGRGILERRLAFSMRKGTDQAHDQSAYIVSGIILSQGHSRMRRFGFRAFNCRLYSLFFALLILGTIQFLVLKVEAAPVIGSSTLTLYAFADSYVNETSLDTNYGSSDMLMINFNSYRCFAYIMFDLSSVTSEMTLISAMLKVYAGSGSWQGPWGSIYVGAHYSEDNSWTEGGIVWDNKPTFEAEATDKCSFGMYSYEGYRTWNVTDDVKVALNEGRLTEVLKFDSGNYGHMSLNSRESSSQPMLVIEYSTSPIYEIYLESSQDTGDTSNLGYIKIEDVFSILPNNLSAVTGSYQAIYQSGYEFNAWETSGGVSVSDPSSQTTAVTISGPGTLRAVGNGEISVYAYDDGSASTSVSRESGFMFALKFKPVFRGILEKVRLYVRYGSENSVRVHVLDEQRQDVVSPLSTTFSSEGWFDVDFSEYNIQINSEFYVGVEWTVDYAPSIGAYYSSDMPTEPECWICNGTEWSETYIPCVIRANVRSTLPVTVLPTPIPPTPTPSSTPTSSPTPTMTPSPSPTPTVTSSPTPPLTPTPTVTPTLTPTESPYATSTPPSTPTPIPSQGVLLPFESVIIIVVAVAAVCIALTVVLMSRRKKGA